jgi:heptosyltransferase-2
VREQGIASGALEPVITVPDASMDDAVALLAEHGWDRAQPLLVVAPGAAYGTAKRWLPGYFGAMLTRVVRDIGARAVLVGTAADRAAADEVTQSIDTVHRAHVIDLTGATTLQTLAGVLRVAAACVSNDSGAMHLAGAVGTPLVALFGPTRDQETAPLTRQGGRADVLFHQVWCRPCMLRNCPIDHRCMKGLQPERVFESVRVLMAARS